MRKHIAFLVFASLMMLAAIASAAVPSELTVQGVLRDSTGQLQSLPVNVSVNLYNAQAGGTSLLATPVGPTTETATNGLFTMPVALTNNDIAQLAAASEAWLEVTVDGAIFPRQRLGAEPYALACKQAETVSCSGCINSAMIGSIDGSKIIGDVPSAAGLLGAAISSMPPANNQVLRYEGGQWVPADVVSTVSAGSGLSGGDITNSGTISLATTIAGQRYFSDGIVVGVSPSPSPSPEPLFMVNDKSGFDPASLQPNQLAFGYAQPKNNWNVNGMCTGGLAAGGKVCLGANGGNWYWGVQQDANNMITEYELGAGGQHYFFDGTGTYQGQISSSGDLNILSDRANSKMVVGAQNGMGFYADGSWASPAPLPQMQLDAVGSLRLQHRLEQGTVSSSGTTVTGVGTQFQSSWVGKYFVWTTANGTRDGASQNVWAQITAVNSPTSLTVDRAFGSGTDGNVIANSGAEKFYVVTPLSPFELPVGEFRAGTVLTGAPAYPVPGICAGGVRAGLTTCLVNVAYAWGFMAGGTTVATIDSGGSLNIAGNAFKPGGGSWNVPSDARLKDVSGKFDRGLREILALDPIRYHYKRDNAMKLPSAEEYIGFLAQEVRKVIPEAVKQRADGYLTVNNDPIMWTMVNALKEEHHRSEELEARLERLEVKLADLSAKRHARR